MSNTPHTTDFAAAKFAYDNITEYPGITPDGIRDVRVRTVVAAMSGMLDAVVFDKGYSLILNNDADLGNMFRAYYDEIAEKWSTTDGESFEEAGPHGLDATFEDVTEWIAEQWRVTNADA